MDDPTRAPTDAAVGSPAGAPPPSAIGTGTGWFADPLGRYDHRWYNGAAWTADVSVDGERYVDPMPVALPGQFVGPGGVPAQHVPWQVPPRPPSRILSVLSLVFGLVGVALGWTPFVFVVGAAAAIAAIVLGIVARGRIVRGLATGGRMAIAGIVLGPIGLALCIVGVILTVEVVDELAEYTDPGPVDAEIATCVADGPAVRISGTVENLDGTRRDYTIVVEVFDGRDLVERVDVGVDDVAPGTVEAWDRTVVTRDDTPADPRCEIFAVNGPFPFGIDPAG